MEIKKYQKKSNKFFAISNLIVRGFLCFVIFLSVLSFALIDGSSPKPAVAATGVNQQLNYQARLLDSAGAVVADGLYNIEFKIYQDGNGCVSGGSSPCSGTLKWTETRKQTNRVTVKNGYFSVNLGSVTAFASNVDWNQDSLWLSINVGGTADTPTPTFDGEMTPFRRMAAVPYAMNANQLGGLDASAFVKLAPTAVQVDSGSLSSIFINKTGASGNILQLQKNAADVLTLANSGAVTFKNVTDSTSGFVINDADGGTSVFNVDTTNERVGIGTSAPGYTLTVADSGSGGARNTAIQFGGGGFLDSQWSNFARLISGMSSEAGVLTYRTGAANGVSAISIEGGAIRFQNGVSSGTGNVASLTERMTIDSSGSVGIGDTTPDYLLDVAGTFGVDGAVTLGDAVGDTVTINSGAWTFANDTTVALTGGVNGLNFDSNTLSIDATNNLVGIGTATPGSTLEVSRDNDSSVSLLLLRNADATYSQSVDFQLNTSKDLVITGGSGSGGAVFNMGTRGYTFNNGDIILATGVQIDFANEIGDKAYWYDNTYGTGIESGTLTDWSGSQFRWRTGGTSASTGTERMLLTTTALNLTNGVGLNVAGASVFTGAATANSTLTANGAVVLGDAAGDTVTVNSGAWTFANDTTVALSGGVNGLNIDSNTLSIDATNNRVGVGTATPEAQLDVAGNDYSLTDQTATKEFSTTFTNGVANQKVDFYMTGTQAFWGTIEVEVTDGYTNQNASGRVVKQFYLGLLAGGTIYTNQARYTDDGGATADNWAISDLSWDATNSRYKITLVHRVSTGNTPTVKMTSYGSNAASKTNFLTMTAGSVYTTDTTVYGRPYVNFLNNVGIGTATPVSLLSLGSDAGTSASGLAFGSTGDTNLYRSAANVLKTDDAFIAGSTLELTTLGTTNTAAFLCRNTSNQLAACSSSATGAAFIQGGNSFGGIGVLGTNDAYDLQFETGGTTKMTILNSNGNVGIGTTGPATKLQIAGGDVLVDNTQWYRGLNSAAGQQPLIRSRGMGYNPSTYAGIQVGQTGDGISLFIDPGSIAGGAFNGGTNELFLPNAVNFIQGNAGSTDWLATTLALNNGSVGIGDTTPDYLLDVAGTFGVDGAVTIGDAVGDAVTVNSGAWTFANDTTVALTGGVNGLNFDSNTLSIDATNDRVGIGTAAPGYKLHVSGDISSPLTYFKNSNGAGGTAAAVVGESVNSGAALGAIGYLGGYDSGNGVWYGVKGTSSVNSTAAILGSASSGGYAGIFTGGNVGIGDTSPDYLLDVAGTFGVDGAVTIGDAVGDAVTVNSGAWTFANDTTVALTGGVNGLNFDSNTLSIDATNNRVGIGTAAPVYNLEVQGTLGVVGSVGTISVSSTGNNLNFSRPAANYITATDAAGTLNLGNSTAVNALQITTTATNDSLVLYGGNVGIGTTAPSYKLDVTGSININGDGNYLRWGAGDAQINETGYKLGFSTWTGSALTEKMSILGNGNVGIGDTTPDSALDVNGVGNFTSQVQSNGIYVTGDASTVAGINSAGTNLQFRTNSIDNRMVIDSTGKVGIGTSTPDSNLHLIGGFCAETSDTGCAVGSGTVQGLNFQATGGGAYGTGTQTLASNSYIQSRGMNLVANGTGLLGSNYNFSSFTFDQVDTYTGKGSFKNSTASAGVFNDEFIPVDPGKFYEMDLWAKSTTYVAGNHAYFGISAYDVDNNAITARYTMRQTGTDTTLAAPLNNGDTTVTLTSASGWNNAAGANSYMRTLSLYGYTNSYGYTYPNYTYTRNVFSNAYADGGVNFGSNTITLSSPWAGGSFASGTAVSNGSDGGNYKYIAAANAVIPNTWTAYSGVIGGIDTTGTNRTYQFPPGTASVKLLFLLNRDVAGNATNVSALSFSETTGRNTNNINLLYDTATVGLTVQAASGQTADLMRLLNSSSGVLAAFSSSGALTLPSNGLAVGTNQLVVSGGNVGIGTASPGQKLEVESGNILVDGGSISLAATQGQSATQLYSYNNADSLWVIQPGATQRLVLADAANHDREAGLYYTPGTTGAAAGQLSIGQLRKNGANWTQGILSLFTNGSERLTINSSGNVGIGDTTPDYMLDVAGTLGTDGIITAGAVGTADNSTYLCRNSTNQLATCLSSGTGAAFVQGGNTFGAIATLGTNDAYDLQFETGGTTKMTIQNSTGNVGIGTTSPNVKLSIANNVATGFLDNYSEYQALLYDAGTAASSYGLGIKGGTMVFNSGSAYSFDRAGSATSMVIDGSGNVGIGDTSPDYLLDVAGTFGVDGAVTIGDAVGDAVTVNSGAWTFANDTTVALSGGLNGLNFDSNTLSIDATNNRVGIGLSNPFSALNVSAPVTVTDFSTPLALFGGNYTANGVYAIGFNYASTSAVAPVALGYKITDSGGDTKGALVFATRDTTTLGDVPTERMRIEANGNVGIGDTTPDALLDVAGSLQYDGNAIFGDAIGDTVTVNSGAWTFANDTTVALSGGLNGLNFDSNTLSIDATNDRVGIGTAAPGYKLDVSSTGAVARFGSTTTNAIELRTDDSATGFWIRNDGSNPVISTKVGDLYFGYAGRSGLSQRFFSGTTPSETLTITGGSVGIGDTSPDYLLDVAGTFGVDGAVTIGDAVGDAVTVNSGAWTFANDTTVALTGGVNGLNFDSNTLSIDATNDRVGIGTAAPATKLEILGSTAYNSELGTLMLRSGNTSTKKLYAGFDDALLNAGYIQSVESGVAWLPTLINPNGGNVGIGDTTPDYKLDVAGTFGVDDAVTIGDAIGDTVTVNSGAWTFANDTTVALTGGVNGLNFDSNTLSIDATNDRVGIGTAAPGYKLDISAADQDGLAIRSAGTAKLFFDPAAGGAVTINNNDSTGFYFQQGASTKVIFDGSGNVGINDTTPTEAKLTVRDSATHTSGSNQNVGFFQGNWSSGSNASIYYDALTAGLYLAPGAGSKVSSIDDGINAINANIIVADSGNAGILNIVKAGASPSYGSGTVDAIRSFYAEAPRDYSGGLRTYTDAYGLYIAEMNNSVVTTGWGVYQASANDKNYFAGNVGIADATPDYLLDVAGTFGVDGAVTIGDAIGDTVTVNSGAWTFANDTTVALTGGVNGLNFDSNTLSIDATNNRVGIGTASPDVDFQLEKMDLGSAWIPTSGVSDNAYLGIVGRDAFAGLVSRNEGNWGSAISLSEVATDNTTFVDSWSLARRTSIGGNDLRITYGNSPDYYNNTSVMTFKANGNVGVGDTADYKLDVAGNIRSTANLIEKKVTFTPTTTGWYRVISGVSGNMGGVVRMVGAYDNAQTDVEIQFNISGYGQPASINETRYAYYNAGVISQSRVSSDGGGNLYLDVYVSTATTPGPITLYGYGPMMQNFVSSPVVGAVVGSHSVRTLTHGAGFRSTEGAVFAETSGSVGIGTTSPGAKLTIKEAGSGYINMGQLNGNSGFSGITFDDTTTAVTTANYSLLGDGVDTYLNRPTGGNIYFRENNADQVTLLTGGNVGIGDTTPSYKLEVNGTGFFNGKLAINSSALGSNALDVYTGSSGTAAAIQSNGIVDGNTVLSVAMGNALTGSAYPILASGSSTGNLFNTIQQNGNGTAIMQALVLGTGDAKSLYNINGGQAWAVGLDNSDSDKFKISGNADLGTTDRFTIDTTGKVGVGTAAPTTMFQVGQAGNTGNITVVGTGTTCTIGSGTGFTMCTSDERLKENILDLGDDTLQKVLNLRPVTYNWNSVPGNDQSVQHTGLIAQEVQAQFADSVGVVYTDAEMGDVYGVDYASLVVPAIKAIQELNTKVDLNKLGTDQAIDLANEKIDTTNTSLESLTTSVEDIDTRLQAVETVQNNQQLAQGIWNGGIVTQDTEFAANVTFSAITTFNGQAVFKNDANFESDVSIGGNITVSDNTAGTVKVLAGQTTVDIVFTKPYTKPPVVNVTPVGIVAPKYGVTNVTTGGFTIQIDPAQATDTQFNWIAVQNN